VLEDLFLVFVFFLCLAGLWQAIQKESEEVIKNEKKRRGVASLTAKRPQIFGHVQTPTKF